MGRKVIITEIFEVKMVCLSFTINDSGIYKALTTPRHEDILFSSRCFIILPFTCRFMIYLKYFREGYEVGIKVLSRPPHPVWIAS